MPLQVFSPPPCRSGPCKQSEALAVGRLALLSQVFSPPPCRSGPCKRSEALAVGRLALPLQAFSPPPCRSGPCKRSEALMPSASWAFQYISALMRASSQRFIYTEKPSRFCDRASFLAERGRFELPKPFRGLHAFQACLLSHSSISPLCFDLPDNLSL